MILTQQEKDMLDNPAGYMASENEKKPASNNLSNDELFKQMDKDLQGLGYNVGEQNEKTIKDVLIEEDIDKGNQYASMPPIDLYEGAKREVRESNGIFEFNGTYDKVIARPNELAENYKIKSEQQEQERLERNKRVNEGTASFWDRVIAYSDRVAESQKKYYQGQFNELNPNYNQNHRYFRTTSTGIPIYNEVDLTKKIGFLDEFVEGGIEGTGVGSVLNGTRTKQIRDIKQKMIEGQPIYQDELDTLNLYYESEKEKQIRGYTKFAQLGRGVGKSLGFSADFILGGGFLKALGVGNLAGNIGLKTYLGAKELGLASGIAKGAKGIAELGVNGILGSAVMTAVNAPLRLFPEYQERMLGNEAKLTDNGNMIFQESDEKPATAIMKSLGGLYISYLTELAGGEALRGVAGGISNVLVKPVGNVAGGAVGRILTSNPALKNFLATSTKELSKRYEQLRGLPVIGKSTGWLKDTVHFDGFLEEMGEEALEDVLRLTFGIDNEERSFDNYVKAIFKTPEEWAIIAGTIALQGAGLSAVSYGVARNMANAGASEEEIVDVLKNSSEAQKKQILDEQIANGMTTIPEEINQNEINKNIARANYENLSDKELNIELKKDEIEEKTYNKLLKGRVTEEQAVANAKLVGQFFKKYGAKNAQTMKAFEEWLDKLDVQYNVPVEQQIAQFQSANIAGVNNNSEIENAKREWEEKGVESKYFKQWFGDSKVVDENGKPLVVYHGSPNEFEIFDSNKNLYGEVSKGFNFFTNKKSAYQNSAKDYADFAGTDGYNRHGKVYETYLSIQKPLHIQYTSNGMSVYNGEKRYSTPVEYYDNNYKQIKEEFEKGNYDGIIIENTDKNDDDSIIYLVPNSNQIKSVNNQGTFDSNNPNIYYQSIFNDIYKVVKDVFLKGDSAKVSELFDYVPELQPLKDYFKDELKDVQFREMSELFDKNNQRMGVYLPFNKTIYFNYSKIQSYRNKEQQFFKTLLHELLHAKQQNLIKYAVNNLNNNKLTKKERSELKEFLDTNEISKEDVINYNRFVRKYNLKTVKNSKELAKIHKEFYSKYNTSAMEVDADNVALALLYQIGKTGNRVISEYASKFEESSKEYEADSSNKQMAEIGAFNERRRTEHFGLGRLDRVINTRTFFQYNNSNFVQRKLDELAEKLNVNNQEEMKDISPADDIFQRTDKSKYLTDNEVNQLEKDKENFVNYVDKLIKNELSYRTQIRVLEKLPSAYNNIPELKGKKVVITQDVYKKIIDLPNKFKKNHFVDRKRALKLPQLISDPNYILKSNSKGNEHRFVIVTSSKNNVPTQRLSIILNPKSTIAIVSAYDEQINISEEKKAGRVLYDKKKELSKTILTSKARAIDSSSNIIPQNSKNITLYQESDNEKRIAGYFYSEIMEKLQSIYSEMGNLTDNDKARSDELMAKAHILEDAIYISEGIEDYGESQNSEIMLNAYYVMSDEKLPDALIEEDSVSTRTYNDLKTLHDEKKAKAEDEYRGYFTESNDKNVITIMSNSDASTALHELGHLFLNGLNELAKVNEDAKAQLDAFNKWLGYTGGEYTIAQQEKFARSFEAYLYNGKAPNSKLRTVFENFKEWLKSVYDYIVNIPEADISDEVQELFDNMFGDDSYYQEKKEAKKILSKVRKIKFKESKEVVNRDNKELDDYAKRHKDVCYSILSTATGKDIKYLKSIFETNSQSVATAKKRENIENLVSEVSDEITKAGGMQPEWREFYVDTGVDYDSDEIKGDYELAEKALRTIINKSYGMIDINSELEERAIYEYGRVNEAQLQYDYLVKEYKKGNRNVVLSAMYEWLDGLSSLREDFENKLIFDLNQIERQDKLNQFEKAKRQIISKALELENRYGINSNQGYQELVKEVMKNLNFLQPADKAKMTANILDISSTEMLMAQLDNIMDIAETMEDVAFRRKLESEIHKELQTTKNIKKNGRTVGKYDYKSNKIFEELRELDKLKPEEANDLRLEMSKFATAEDNGLSYKDKIINKFLSYKANGRTYADTDLMKELYDEIIKIKMIGKSAKSEIDLQEKLSEGKDIDELINIVQNKKEAGAIKKNYISWLGNLESTLNAIFNNKIKEKYASEVLYAETQAQAWQHEIKTKFEKEVAKIYNLPEWMWDKKIIDYLAEKHTYSEIRRKYDEKGELVKQRNIDRTLTKMDIIQAYIWSKNEVLEKRLINQFGEDTLYSMFDELSLQDVRFAELLMETAQSFYPMVNRAFIRKYGLDLPKVSCYFPSTPERGSEVDLFNEYSSKSLNNGFTKQRAQSETVAMDFHNPVATLYSHIDGVAKFSFMSEALDKINLRFKDNDLKRVIVNKFGEDVYRTLEQCLINVTYKKEATVFNGVNKILDNMIGNWIQANIAIKPMVGLKQLLSANNYAVDMPYMTWQKGFLKALAHPKETIDYMMSIPYLKARYEGNFSNEFLKAQIENSAFSTSKKLKDLCTVFVKMGDIGAIIFGGKPYIDYLVKEKGLEEDEAIKQFILSTNRSQQSSAVSSLSNFQVNMTRNPAGKLFIAFKNSPQQYIRMCGDAIISATNGDISKKQAVKLLFQYGYLQPLLYAVATSGSLLRWLFAGDDDDFLKDLSVSIFNLGSDSLPIIGDIYKYAINKMLYKEKNLPATTPLLGDMEKEINRISKEDVSVKDYFEAIGYLGLHVGLGYNSKAIGNMASGVGDIFTGEPVQGTMKILGYTKKRAEHIAGND